MCLITFSYRDHPDYELIFAGNRDEFYERPARGAQFWEEHPQVLAGKDLEAGGTWLGVDTSGRYAALTNYRDPSIRKESAPSRGFIPLDYLESHSDPGSFLEHLDGKSDRYNGFCVLAGNLDQLLFYSNQEQEIKPVEPGIHGLSNHLLDTPWPKVERAKEKMRHITRRETIREEALFELLSDETKAEEEDLPETGIPGKWEKEVSSIFINTERYGTRCSTLLLIDKNRRITFVERRFEPGTSDILETNRFEFTAEP